MHRSRVIEPVNGFDLRGYEEFRIVQPTGIAETFQFLDSIRETILEPGIKGGFGIMDCLERFDVVRRGVLFGVDMFTEIGLNLAGNLAASCVRRFIVVAITVPCVCETALRVDLTNVDESSKGVRTNPLRQGRQGLRLNRPCRGEAHGIQNMGVKLE